MSQAFGEGFWGSSTSIYFPPDAEIIILISEYQNLFKFVSEITNVFSIDSEIIQIVELDSIYKGN